MKQRSVKPGTTIWKSQGEEPPYLNIPRNDVVWTFGKPGTLAMGAEYRGLPYSQKNPYRGLVALADIVKSERGKRGTWGVGGDSGHSGSSTMGVS